MAEKWKKVDILPSILLQNCKTMTLDFLVQSRNFREEIS